MRLLKEDEDPLDTSRLQDISLSLSLSLRLPRHLPNIAPFQARTSPQQRPLIQEQFDTHPNSPTPLLLLHVTHNRPSVALVGSAFLGPLSLLAGLLGLLTLLSLLQNAINVLLRRHIAWQRFSTVSTIGILARRHSYRAHF